MQLNQHTLTLSANNGAIASKLRQMTTEIAAKLHDNGCEVTVIQVVVQVHAPPCIPPPETRSISLSGKTHLTELAERLADSPLKDVLKRLAKRNEPK
jgi:hypothetical protein